MSEVIVFAPGGYRYIKAVFLYSGGVAAEPGFEIEHARFRRPLPIGEGFQAVEAHLASIGRPASAFAQCALRSPAPFTDQGFFEFNKLYVTTLARWGIKPTAMRASIPSRAPTSVPCTTSPQARRCARSRTPCRVLFPGPRRSASPAAGRRERAARPTGIASSGSAIRQPKD